MSVTDEQLLSEGMDEVRGYLMRDGYLRAGRETFELTVKAEAALPLLLTVCAMTDPDYFRKVREIADQVASTVGVKP